MMREGLNWSGFFGPAQRFVGFGSFSRVAGFLEAGRCNGGMSKSRIRMTPFLARQCSKQ